MYHQRPVVIINVDNELRIIDLSELTRTIVRLSDDSMVWFYFPRCRYEQLESLRMRLISRMCGGLISEILPESRKFGRHDNDIFQNFSLREEISFRRNNNFGHVFDDQERERERVQRKPKKIRQSVNR